jgi:putative addiction module component (TIGR02574 family)
MNVPSDIVNQVLSLPARERFELAQQLLDSIDDAASAKFDEELVAELQRRREEMLRGEAIVPDWRAALLEIEESLSTESSG